MTSTLATKRAEVKGAVYVVRCDCGTHPPYVADPAGWTEFQVAARRLTKGEAYEQLGWMKSPSGMRYRVVRLVPRKAKR